jgi:hypothetical protein
MTRALRLLAPAGGLALMALAVALWVWDRPGYFGFFRLLGAGAFRTPFVDWEGVSAFVECWRRGVDVYLINPCDVRGQLFNYSPLWLGARFIPFGAAWRNAIGLGMDAVFFASLWWVLRPQTWGEAGIAVLAALSPATVMGAERANIDLALFAFVAAAAILAADARRGRRLLAYGLLLLAGLLKFYPLVGLVVALKERPKIFWAVCGVCVAVFASFVVAYRHELPLVLAAVPHPPWDMNTFGGPNLIGWARDVAPADAFVWIIAALAVAAALAGARMFLLGADVDATLATLAPRDRTLLIVGAAIMVGCFATGLSGDYRAVFLILVEAGLLAARRIAPPPLRRRADVVILISLLVLWEPMLRPLVRAAGPVVWLVWWPGHELCWWALTGALAAIVARFAWDSETARALTRRAAVEAAA